MLKFAPYQVNSVLPDDRRNSALMRANKRKRARNRARYSNSNPIMLPLAIKLALLGDTFKRFARAFDPVLVFIAFWRQQFNDFERTACANPPKGAACVADVLTNGILMCC
jgi:hypothetical protein